jgi:hypothetical protein
MERPPSRGTWQERGRATDVGIALVEVLVAIFIMGVGLLSLLTLFPLGALNMAEAIKGDRTAAIAAESEAFSKAGEELLAQTADFVEISLSKGSVDPDMATRLREKYGQLMLWAEELEIELKSLQGVYPRRVIQPHVGPLLAEIRSIRLRMVPIVRILSLVDNDESKPIDQTGPS